MEMDGGQDISLQQGISKEADWQLCSQSTHPKLLSNCYLPAASTFRYLSIHHHLPTQILQPEHTPNTHTPGPVDRNHPQLIQQNIWAVTSVTLWDCFVALDFPGSLFFLFLFLIM